ncbi:Protein N-terminal and lysine N-methyltransferase efm7 [Sporothrix eucalyptigena]|uniref:Protein N-terminal and lysine N-methyltransferase efm7 n=1 Tax=Sporothrix eucalyptigena TaxID=1812306 RepID=A0ABP0BHF2_9PEZI
MTTPRVREDHHSDDDNDNDNNAFDGGLFADPPDYYPPSPPPTTEQHALGRSGVQLTLHLVGHSVLEAHRLWNGSRVLADYLEDQQEKGHPLVKGRTVLELGAGAALPGIVCGIVLGARKVVVTDYPDPDLVVTMRRNIDEAEAGLASAVGSSALQAAYGGPGTVVADGYIWGGDPVPLLAHLASASETASVSEDPPKYDVVLLADLLFRHAEHSKLAYSVQHTLKKTADSRAYVFFTSYRPWLRHKDLAFFGHACAAGLVVEHLLEKRLEKPPLFFENDPGDVSVRSTVSGYSLRWPAAGEDPATFWPPPGGIEGADSEVATATPSQGISQGETPKA